eukprot:TRINITY_DN417_c0_g1_i15.p1 TRINITY_DN417_c0_g1~~TRINITY_DN417_c0_g1_i15.p1  ORF type:complete len:138 (+),score=16.23 TRINITY_DN417_c0_g1_i15:129-542(+)
MARVRHYFKYSCNSGMSDKEEVEVKKPKVAPARKAGGKRKAGITAAAKKAHESKATTESEDIAQTSTTKALEPKRDHTAVVPKEERTQELVANKDENPKAVASTYHPPAVPTAKIKKAKGKGTGKKIKEIQQPRGQN